MSNQRSAYRVPFNAQAELYHDGHVVPALVVNMSAGGMLVAAEADIPTGEHVGLGLHLFDELRTAAGLEYLHFDLEVLEVIEDPADDVTARQYRCRNLTVEGSPAAERVRQVVFTAERERLAAESGMGGASPMATDAERREQLRREQLERYSKASVNPLHNS